MKISELRQIIREEILKEARSKDKIEVNYMGYKWTIQYMDGSHIKMGLANTNRYDVYNIDQLRDKSYYKDLVNWIENSDSTISKKKYK